MLKPSPYNTACYLETLRMLSDLFNYARKHGLVKLETDVDDPHNSPIFSKYPMFLRKQSAVHFLCDTLRMSISGGVGPFELDQMMELDLEVHHQEAQQPVKALSTMADSLPGLGIVAAVLGVVVTMGALGGPPEEIGHKVAAALVGTFLGILLSYGFCGPLAAYMSHPTKPKSSTTTACGSASSPSSAAVRPSWPSSSPAAPSRPTSAPPSRIWKPTAKREEPGDAAAA